MKIAFFHLLNDKSGSPNVLSQVIKTLANSGHSTTLMTSSSSDSFLNGCAHEEFFFKYTYSSNKIVLLLKFFFAQLLLFVKSIVHCRNHEVFYINTILPFGAAIAALILRKKVIYHIHESYVNPPLLKKFLRFIVSLAANKVVFVSNHLKEVEGFSNTPSTVIYNTIPDFFFNAKMDEEMNSHEKFNVLMISSLKTYKGVFEFIKIATKALEKKGNAISFTLVVNAGQQEIDNFFHTVQIPENTIIYPVQNDTIPFYQSSKLLLNLTRVDECIETFGLTILEGFALGVPAIVPPIGGPAEILRDEIDGYCISSSDIEKVVDTIIKLYENEILYEQLSSNALERSQNFSNKVFNQSIQGAITSL